MVQNSTNFAWKLGLLLSISKVATRFIFFIFDSYFNYFLNLTQKYESGVHNLFLSGTLVLGVVGVVGQLAMLAVDLVQLLEPGDEE